MDKKTIDKLERELAQAMAEVVIVRNKKWKYPLMPSQLAHLAVDGESGGGSVRSCCGELAAG